MTRRELLLLSAASVGAGLAGTTPARAATHLRIGLGGAFTTMDPHFFHATPNHTVAMHIFDRLVDRSPDGKLIPGLAESWTMLSPTLWEFKLRPNVKFHDGGEFTADDAVYTFQRAANVPNAPTSFAIFLRQVAKTEVPDKLTLRIHTPAPAPDLLTNLTYVSILSRRVGEGATTADYNSGKAAIGTGPYQFGAYAAGDRVELKKFPGFWGPEQPWDNVTLKLIVNLAARTAALLAGDVDVIDTPSVSDLQRLRDDPKTSVASIPGIRVMYIVPGFTSSGNNPLVTDNNGRPLPKNPFHDKRVRRALSISINREALTDRVMLKTATPTGQWMPAGLPGHNPEVPVPAYDPARAKALLAEAGYPDGFKVTLHTPNDRYPNDAQTAQVVAQMWTRAGVQTSVEALPWNVFYSRGAKQEFAIALWGWGSVTFEGSYMLTACLTTYNKEKSVGLYNYGRYSNPDVDAISSKVQVEMDDGKRVALIKQGTQLVLEDEAIAPLFMLGLFWAFKRGITVQPRADERTLARDIRPV